MEALARMAVVTQVVCVKWDALRATANDSRIRKKNVKLAYLRERLRSKGREHRRGETF
jgi:hypothetical protein